MRTLRWNRVWLTASVYVARVLLRWLPEVADAFGSSWAREPLVLEWPRSASRCVVVALLALAMASCATSEAPDSGSRPSAALAGAAANAMSDEAGFEGFVRQYSADVAAGWSPLRVDDVTLLSVVAPAFDGPAESGAQATVVSALAPTSATGAFLARPGGADTLATLRTWVSESSRARWGLVRVHAHVWGVLIFGGIAVLSRRRSVAALVLVTAFAGVGVLDTYATSQLAQLDEMTGAESRRLMQRAVAKARCVTSCPACADAADFFGERRELCSVPAIFAGAAVVREVGAAARSARRPKVDGRVVATFAVWVGLAACAARARRRGRPQSPARPLVLAAPGVAAAWAALVYVHVPVASWLVMLGDRTSAFVLCDPATLLVSPATWTAVGPAAAWVTVVAVTGGLRGTGVSAEVVASGSDVVPGRRAERA